MTEKRERRKRKGKERKKEKMQRLVYVNYYFARGGIRSLTRRKDENGWKDGAKGVEQGAGPVLQEHVAKFKQLRGMLRRPPTCLGRQVSRKPLIALSRLHRGEVGRGMSRGDKVWDRVRRRQAHRRNGGRKRWVMVWLYCAHARLYLLGYTITAPSR